LSANVLTEAHDKAMEIGMNEYLAKPFKKKDLEDIVKKFLES